MQHSNLKTFSKIIKKYCDILKIDKELRPLPISKIWTSDSLLVETPLKMIRQSSKLMQNKILENFNYVSAELWDLLPPSQQNTNLTSRSLSNRKTFNIYHEVSLKQKNRCILQVVSFAIAYWILGNTFG